VTDVTDDPSKIAVENGGTLDWTNVPVDGFTDVDREADRISRMSPAEIDAWWREHGKDPEQVVKDFNQTVARAIREVERNTFTLTWSRGFPEKSGMYLVELAEGEHVVTPYRAEPRYVGADQEWDNRTGWVCLTNSRATVVAWTNVPKFRR
jgi:hypothetical protein